MLELHANVYALPHCAIVGPEVTLRGLSLPTLCSEAGGPPAFLATLPVTFEEMQASLLELPRSDCEPDGFFLITGHEDGKFWRLNGHMHEYEGQMHRVEFHGECPAATLDDVLRTMGWPDAKLAFELVKEGVTLRENEFRKYCESSAQCVSRVVPTAAAPPSISPPRKFTAVEDDAAHVHSSVAYTSWHITFGTYGTRLHGDIRPTVDRDHNHYGEAFVNRNDLRRKSNEEKLQGPPVRLSQSQRELIEQIFPAICERGGWKLHAVAAQPDHVHVVCDICSNIHGEKVRRLMKRWLTDALNAQWPDDNRPRWWAVQGSNKAINDEAYLKNAIAYVERQKASRS
jgi:REP element-mobilizing transposase RayT